MVKRFLVAFIIGSFAIVAIEVSLIFVTTVIAELNEWDSFAVGLGPVGVFSYYTSEDVLFRTTHEIGILFIALLGGILNGLGAVFLRGRD